MKELDKLRRAQLYMEQLSRGVNPLDGSPVGPEDVVQQVRISRCLTYVARVLGQEIARQEAAASVPSPDWGPPHPAETEEAPRAPRNWDPKPQKQPFALAYYKRAEFRLSQEPLYISEFADRLNALAADESRKKLTHQNIRDWLLFNELLYQTKNDQGRTQYLPTQAGKGIGILEEVRETEYGMKKSVRYSKQAQQYILDNLDAVIEFQARNKEMKGQLWDRQQDEHLRQLYYSGTTIKEMAWQLQRTPGAIRGRLKRLGLEE